MKSGQNKIIIVGASAAGVSAAREIRNVDKEAAIYLLSEETYMPYYRPFLTEYIANKKVMEKSAFYILSEEWCRDERVALKRGERAVKIDPAQKSVYTESRTIYEYDKLILACGSTPFVPIQNALKMHNVFAIRTLDDADHVFNYSNKIKRAVVIGGGLLGLEAAYSLIKKGVHVTVIELATRILPNQLDDEGSLFYMKLVGSDRISLIFGKSVASIVGDDRARSVMLSTGEQIDTDMIVFSIGIRSNIQIAQECGIKTNRAIVVNERMETSENHVYACGDVAEYSGRTTALWMNATRQGRVAGINAAGGDAAIEEWIYPVVLNSFETKVFSAGDVCAMKVNEDITEQKMIDEQKKIYKKLYFKKDRLVGFILIGDITESQKLLKGIKTGISSNECVVFF